ncbi:alpha/beta fold hydrolase [Fodinibius salsisoli]|uniref:Alpha/beta hydrolase n=1 Tax=Fodinibius salsisoli TaxID=2820877 RepID=A0ABT3PHY3_9BACT|nr:alpha/beta hydrolase [Fodinibius salsisoli]MCW9705525.1 alpha/beta hydrolase [Fodinibius salsisoli]
MNSQYVIISEETTKNWLFVLPVVLWFVACAPAFAQTDKPVTGYAPINGLKMYYEIHGTGGTPLVLIHGGGSTIETSFGNILPFLADDRKVIAVELQAHGRTSDRAGALSFEQDADDVAGLMAHLNIKKANFFGFSNGGNTAMQIGIRHPDVVNKLIVASALYEKEGLVPGFWEQMKKATLENMPAPLKTAYIQVAADINNLKVMHDKDKERMLTFQDWPDDDLRSIKASTLIMVGDRDIITAEHAVKMSQLIPDARLMILPGTHGSYIGEVVTTKENSKMPEITAELIDKFLNE